MSLKKNTLWMLSGNVVYSISQWLLLIIIARLGTPEVVGHFTYALALTAPFIMFFNLRLRFVLATDAEDKNSFSDYLSLRLILSLVALFFILSTLWLFDLQDGLFLIVILVALAKYLESISDIYLGLLQKEQVMHRLAKSMIIKGLLTTSSFAVLYYQSNDLALSLVSLVIVWSIVLVFYDKRSVFYLNEKNNRAKYPDLISVLNGLGGYYREFMGTLYRLAIRALPLGFVALLISLSTNIPRYVIEAELGATELGFYGALNYILMAGVLAISSVGQTTMPKMADCISTGDIAGFIRLLNICLGLALAAGIVGLSVTSLFGPELLALLYGQEYSMYYRELNWMMLAGIFNYMALFLWYALTALNSYKSQLMLFIIDVLLITVLSLYLVPLFGVSGAIYTLIFIMIFHVIFAGLIVVTQVRKVSANEQGAVGV